MKLIYCKFFKKKMPQLESQPFPGKLGKRIFYEISKEAWNFWMVQQTILINEKNIDVSSKENREFLMKKMEDFFFLK
ncbi:oxidative damage protection protein [Candidatus Riesia pediculicola]|uniref:oxidative damage protection protein n=1 Tax=Candidatus Riesia pediculicola TaxID=401619 RepID=UPI0009C39472|nr:oxidative damage protection protein [Candidatus Riesia pediculicola]ARC54059.1 iron transporter [Candidatus Riesia pediculicola]